MRNRRLARAATGLIAGAATICLLTLPVAADTVDVDVTDGDLEILDEAGDPVDTIDLSAPGTTCGATSSTITASGNSSSGTISGSLSSNSATNIAGTNYRVQLTTTIVGGTYTVGSPTTVSLSTAPSPPPSVTAVATLVRTTGAGSCTPISGAGNCTVTAGNLSLTGTLTHANPMPDLTSGDIALVSGGNSTGDVVVTGTATNCGVMITANNGSVTVSGLEVEVI